MAVSASSLARSSPGAARDETMLRTDRVSQEWGAGTHIHVAETQVEVEMNLESRGNRHIEWLEELGVLGPGMQLVHSVWLSDDEIDLIAERWRGGRALPGQQHVPGLRRGPRAGDAQRGITVALATDGPGSNNSQDMMETLKITALLHKVNTLDAMALLPEDVLWMACRGGAVAFGQPDLIGSLEVGKKADVVLVDLDTPLAMPVHRVPSALVYNCGARDVDTVIVDGRILMRHKEITVLDEKALLARARQSCSNLFERAGVVVDESEVENSIQRSEAKCQNRD